MRMRKLDSAQSELVTALKQRFNASDIHSESRKENKLISFKVNPKIKKEPIEKLVNSCLGEVEDLEIYKKGEGSYTITWVDPKGLDLSETDPKLMKALKESDFDSLSDILVPGSGKADTVAGEIIRAFDQINYRWYNDGDYFWGGYGLEVAGSSAEYLMDNIPEVKSIVENYLESIMSIPDDSNDQEYEDVLEDIKTEVMEYLRKHPELLSKHNETDSRFGGTRELLEMSPSFSFETSFPKTDVAELLENRGIDMNRAIQDYVENIVDYHNLESDPYISVYDYTVDFDGLKLGDYQQIKDEFENIDEDDFDGFLKSEYEEDLQDVEEEE